MPNFAIVIGIDAYANEKWNLSTAVTDAIRFAEWALGPGGVPRKNLRLLLSANLRGVTRLRHRKATRNNIVEALQEFQGGPGHDGGRLYFYYAGHGVSGPGAAPTGNLEPVLIPADVESFERDTHLLLGFSEIMPLLLDAELAEQFFFIDACRDFALENYLPGIGRSVGRYSPPRTNAGSRSAQYVLYATAPGYSAYENQVTGIGVFAQTLLNGLTKTTPALSWSTQEQAYVVRFSTLVDYVRREVERAVKLQARVSLQNYIQIPESQTQGSAADALLRSFSLSEVEKLSLSVRVQPSVARQSCRVQVIEYSQGGRNEVEVATSGPPALQAMRFELAPGHYTVVAQAETYTVVRQPCSIYQPQSLSLELTPGQTQHTPVANGDFAMLTVYCADPNIAIVVRDAERQLKGSGAGRLQLRQLTPGIYRVQMMLPEGPSEEQTVEAPAGETIFNLQAGGPHIGYDQQQMLSLRGITADLEGNLHPSEQLPAIADAKLASLLGFAAFAAHRTVYGDFQRLRSIGVRSLAETPSGAAALLVLIGVAGEPLESGTQQSQLLGEAKLLIRNREGSVIDTGGFEQLSGFAAAAQRGLSCSPGPLDVELHFPGLAPTHYALVGLPDRVTVLIVVTEPTGGFDVQQYLLSLRAGRFPYEYLNDNPANIRRIELAQRYYANGQAIPDPDTEEMLFGKWLDPLLGCLAGYSLVQTGRAERYIGAPDQSYGENVPEPSAMRNMLKFFPELPDSHVLAGLCQPERRGEHYAAALARGLPVLAAGFQALHQWYTTQGQPLPVQLRQVSRGSLPGSPWTAWSIQRPALVIRDGHFDAPPLGWEGLDTHRTRIERVCASVGRIEVEGHPTLNWTGTGFLVGTDTVMTSWHVVAAAIDRQVEDRSVLLPGITLRIDFQEELGGSAAAEFDVVEILGIHPLLDLALLRIARSSRQGAPLPAPLMLASSVAQPLDGRQVYVVGYPSFDPRTDHEVLQRIFTNTWNIKRLQPGEIVDIAADPGLFCHDCFTLGGNAGSCVVDLETEQVLGLHISGQYVPDKQAKYNQAVALWMLHNDPLLVKAQVNFG